MDTFVTTFFNQAGGINSAKTLSQVIIYNDGTSNIPVKRMLIQGLKLSKPLLEIREDYSGRTGKLFSVTN
jgi:hypothetical protein